MDLKDQIYDILLESYNQLEDIPTELHLLCPKISDDDDADYDNPSDDDEDGATAVQKKQRIEDGKKRRDIAYKLSLLLGMNEESAGSWLPSWSARVSTYLTKCDSCVRLWHKSREEFLAFMRE